MGKELINPVELTIYQKELDIIKSTAAQIIKDFEIHNEEISFSGKSDTAYGELCDQIEPIIKKLLSNNVSRFHSLLYRIDVDEEKVKAALTAADSPTTKITKLIIERELLKVVTREYFSKI